MGQILLPALEPNLWLSAVGWAYLATNACRVLSYVPQIVAVWRCSDGAQAISLATWGSWSVSHLTALLYGTLVVHDSFLVSVSLINLAGCSVVTWIAYRRRRAHARMHPMPEGMRRPRTDSA